MRLLRLLPLISGIVLAGCASSPMLKINEDDVGLILQPISKSSVIDSRREFRSLFCSVSDHHAKDFPGYPPCDQSLHLLSDEPADAKSAALPLQPFNNKTHILIIPGIFGECMGEEIQPFMHAVDHLNTYQKMTAEIMPLRADYKGDSTYDGIGGRASSAHNAKQIHYYLSDLIKIHNFSTDEKLILIGYSKGVTDILYYLNNNEYKSTYSLVDGVVSVAGVVNGSPLADDTNLMLKKILDILPYSKCPVRDESGVEDITRRKQLSRLSAYTLPKNIKYFSVSAFAKRDNISSILRSSYDRLSLVDPRNDSQVIYYDSILPGSYLMAYANADHWAVALPFRRNIKSLGFMNKTIARSTDKNDYPREVLLESIVRFVDAKLE